VATELKPLAYIKWNGELVWAGPQFSVIPGGKTGKGPGLPPGPKPSWWTSDEWETPPEVITALSDQYGPFDLDPCARPETAKAPVWYTKADDGLALDWFGTVYCNPPYSAPKPWCQKATAEIVAGHAERVVMLLPAAVDTHWFHDHVVPYADVIFIRGRIKFLGWQGTPIGSPTSGNILAVYQPTPSPPTLVT
jgi:phage N-6-adenine-methyltransferase